MSTTKKVKTVSYWQANKVRLDKERRTLERLVEAQDARDREDSYAAFLNYLHSRKRG